MDSFIFISHSFIQQYHRSYDLIKKLLLAIWTCLLSQFTVCLPNRAALILCSSAVAYSAFLSPSGRMGLKILISYDENPVNAPVRQFCCNIHLWQDSSITSYWPQTSIFTIVQTKHFLYLYVFFVYFELFFISPCPCHSACHYQPCNFESFDFMHHKSFISWVKANLQREMKGKL